MVTTPDEVFMDQKVQAARRRGKPKLALKALMKQMGETFEEKIEDYVDQDILGDDAEVELPQLEEDDDDDDEQEEQEPEDEEITCICKLCRNCRCRKAGKKCNNRCHGGSECSN